MRVGERVREVCSAEQGLAVTYGDGMVEYFDKVIVTAPCPIVERLCPELSAAEKERLAIESARLADTLRTIRDGVVTVDRRGYVLLMNDGAEKMTGLPRSKHRNCP